MEKNIIYKNLFKLWSFFEKKRKFQISGVLLLMIVASFTEVIGIGAVFPFLTILVQPELIYKIEFVPKILNFLGYQDIRDFILPLTIFFIFMLLLNGIIRLILLYIQSVVSHKIGADLGLRMIKNCLNQNYEYHINVNSSEIINTITGKNEKVIVAVIFPILNLLGSTMIFLAIFLGLFFFKPLIATLSVFVIGIFYFIFMQLTRLRLKNYSNTESTLTTKAIQALQECLGGIKNIIIDGSQNKFTSNYHKTDYQIKMATSKVLFVSMSPRFSIEAIGMSIIALIGYILSLKTSGIITIIPVLGALVLASQKMLPLLQTAYLSWATIHASSMSLVDVIKLLELPPNNKIKSSINKIKFTKMLELSDISFKYRGSENYTLKNINLVLKKNETLGIIGPSGSGKSTLINIILGLLSPDKGFFKVDNHVIDKNLMSDWQSIISHVPQNIFLADSSIIENIALSSEKNEIDMNLIIKVSKMAQLYDFVQTLPNKFNTQLGERGARISGGQQQRIGIARALYKQPKLIIFDEATSALDEDVEKSIIKTIENLGKEISTISISHKRSVLTNCSNIIEIKNGTIRKLEKYN